MVGLDDSLTSVDSPVDKIKNSMWFNSNLDRNALFGSKVRSISADKITAGTINSSIIYSGTISGSQITSGTITVGGTANGNGLITVLNESGGTASIIDKSGITVIGGNISIKNTGGTTIIDSAGIISDTDSNFQNSFVSGSNMVRTDHNSFVDISGSTITLTITRAARVMIFLFVYGMYEDYINELAVGEIEMYDSFTSSSTNLNCFFTGSWATSIDWNDFSSIVTSSSQSNSNLAVVTMAAGTHNLKLRFRSTGDAHAKINNWGIGYLVLGR